MKTTFKKVFFELDDDLMNMNDSKLSAVDIDMDKISGNVFDRIGNDKKKVSTRFVVFLVAAVIMLVGAVGVFASKNVKEVFSGFFNKGSNLNNVSVYDGGDVKTESNGNYDINLVGVTGDNERLYSVIEITRKDGKEVIDKEYTRFSNSTRNDVRIQLFTESGEKTTAYSGAKFELCDNNKLLRIYTYSFGIAEEIRNGRMVVSGSYLDAWNISRVLASKDLPESMKEAEEMSEEDFWFDEQYLEQLRAEYGLEKDECAYFDHGFVRDYCECTVKEFSVPFEVSFDLDYNTDSYITTEIDSKSVPSVVEDYAMNTELTITPFGVYLSGEYESDNIENSEYMKCFKVNDNNELSKLVLDDGTVYYLYSMYLSDCETKNNGVSQVKYPLFISNAPGIHYELNFNVIDTSKVKEIYINGDLVYRK